MGSKWCIGSVIPHYQDERIVNWTCDAFGSKGEWEKFTEDTCAKAHDVAARFCELKNAKVAEPKPPEGFCFSKTPGIRGPDGEALAWVEGYGFEGINPGDQSVRVHPWRWLVPDSLASKPDAPKKKTLLDADDHLRKNHSYWSEENRAAFRLGVRFAND